MVVLPCDKVLMVIERAEKICATEAHIVNAIKRGSSLSSARETFGYSKPWSDMK